MLTLYVVRFAHGMPHPETGEKAPPRVMVITEAEYDRWWECEPPQGYDAFETLYKFECEHITDAALAAIQRLVATEPAEQFDVVTWLEVASPDDLIVCYGELQRLVRREAYKVWLKPAHGGEARLHDIDDLRIFGMCRLPTDAEFRAAQDAELA